jgi:hypothetical protein
MEALGNGSERSHSGQMAQQHASVDDSEPSNQGHVGVEASADDDKAGRDGATRGGVVCGPLPQVPVGVTFYI